jgi:hypothetical protein
MNTRVSLWILLIVALLMPTSMGYAAPTRQADHFRLEANAGWAATGFFVEEGQEVTITAHGRALTAPINFFGPGSISGPNGQVGVFGLCPNTDPSPPCAMENAPCGALVGKIGEDGEPFFIGSDLTFTAATSGELYLAVNDLLPFYDDNRGNYMVFFNQ